VRPNPFARPGDDAQRTGRRFEPFWAKLFGREPTRGSGNQWTMPMDVGDGHILWSLKYSEHVVLRFGPTTMKALMQEIDRHTRGDGTVSGVATHGEDGETYVTLRSEDFIRMCQTGSYQYITPTRGAQKMARAKLPALLRDDEDV